MVWYGMVWYGMVWYGVVWYGAVQCGACVICGVVHVVCALYVLNILTHYKLLASMQSIQSPCLEYLHLHFF